MPTGAIPSAAIRPIVCPAEKGGSASHGASSDAHVSSEASLPTLSPRESRVLPPAPGSDAEGRWPDERCIILSAWPARSPFRIDLKPFCSLAIGGF